MWGPRSIAKLVHITPISLWFMVLITSYNYSYWGLYNQLITGASRPLRWHPTSETPRANVWRTPWAPLSWPIRCENVFGERLWGTFGEGFLAELRLYGDEFEISIGIYIYSTVKDINMITIITIMTIRTIVTRKIRIENVYIYIYVSYCSSM